jgi:hypothetical protein
MPIHTGVVQNLTDLTLLVTSLDLYLPTAQEKSSTG